MSKNIINTPNVVHVRIDNPISTRKEILKTAIDTTKMLYSYNEILMLRDKETKLINKFKVLHKEIIKLQKNLEDADLPKISDKYENTSHEPEKIEKETIVNDDVDRLMAELRDVERKLNSL